MFRTHTCGELTAKNVGEEVTLAGWVHKRRDLGGLIFVDLRDRYGLTQVVFHPDKVANFSLVEDLKYEYVIKIKGKVEQRKGESVNKNLATGEIEILVEEISIISKAKTLPFEIFDARKEEEDEELRLKYRFLELRREKLKQNILFRAKMIKYLRDFMDSRNFLEIATPILTVSSPEGARDFLVPSRIHPGKFYALPQAPQQYKQLLMVAGFDKYYQIAACLRDEDPRADRSPGEFYQLDVETSFLTQDEFFAVMEPLFVELTEKLTGKTCLNKPFPRIPFKEVMESYGSDRPDLRCNLKLMDVSEWGKNSGFQVFASAKYVRALVIPEGHNFSRKEIEEEFTDKAKRAKAKGLAWLKYVDGKFEGTIAKFFDETKLNELKKILVSGPHPNPPLARLGAAFRRSQVGEGGVELQNAMIFFVADDNWMVSCLALGAVRQLSAEKLNLLNPNQIAWAWVVDFPMYEWNDNDNKIDFAHNPFSMPQGGMEALKTKDPIDILAYQYDIIANGLEISSGAVRNMDPEIMYEAFRLAGYAPEVVDKKFGHMIDAFQFGAPPHCGFAPGIERLAMLLLGEKNIRSVVPFPKNQKAEEPMMGSPSVVDEKQLKELHIKLDVTD